MRKFFCLILVASIANADISRVQFKSGSGNTASLVITLDAAPTDGNLLVVGAGLASSNISSISQTGATWTLATRIISGTGTSEVWYAENVSGAGTGVTITVSGGAQNIGAVVAEYQGALMASSLDKVASSSGTWDAANPVLTGPTTTKANELWFVVSEDKNPGSLWQTATSGYTEIAEETTGATGSDVDTAQDEKAVLATGALSATFGKNPVPISGTWTISGASFIANISSGTEVMPMMGMGG